MGGFLIPVRGFKLICDSTEVGVIVDGGIGSIYFYRGNRCVSLKNIVNPTVSIYGLLFLRFRVEVGVQDIQKLII